MFKEVIMEFENQEVIDRVVLELHKTVNFNSMTTSQHRCFLNYLRLVDKCYTLESSRYSEGVRGANHHILPRSLYQEYDKTPRGVSNWNVVLMTRKEHFVAHHLLFEIYDRSGPMAKALSRMCNRLGGTDFNEKFKINFYDWNYEVSEQTKKKISKSKKGFKHSEISKSRMSKSKSGRVLSESHKLKLSDLLRSRVITEETREKLRVKSLGMKNPRFGVVVSEETRLKLSGSSKGRVHSDLTKKKISEAQRGVPKKVITCPHCGRSGGSGNLRRYHFDNCKKKPS